MKPLKNIFVGFMVSFIGSIPLGYLNIIGFQIYKKSGLEFVIFYLFGVIFIEAFVIFFTLVLSKQLTNNIKLIKYIELFSIFFMFFLAYTFFSQANIQNSNQETVAKYFRFTPLIIGLILSSFNFIQIPFWMSWNLYLVTSGYIFVEKNLKFTYLFGTLIGTFLGMLALILSLDLIINNSENISNLILSRIIPLFFTGMGFFQAFKYLKKYNFKTNKNN